MKTAPAAPVAPPRLGARLGAWLHRLARPRLLGPVLSYDLIRSARRGRTFLLRSCYIFTLLTVLFLLYLQWIGRGRDVIYALTGTGSLDKQDVDRFAAHFFLLFFAVQLGAVLLLTPVFTASCVAEERTRGTLDFLLVTDLENQEIVLGKLTARLLLLLLVLLGGLPVLSFLTLAGGVDPNLVLAGFVVTAATLLSLGSLGVYNSVKAQTPRGAVFATYAQAIAFLALTFPFGPARALTSPFHWLGAGNPVVAYERAVKGIAASTGAAILPPLRDYLLLHAGFTVVLVVLASRRLRETAPATVRLEPPLAGTWAALAKAIQVAPPSEGPLLPRPRVGDEPILWKELHAERSFALPILARNVLFFLASATLAIAFVVFLCGLIFSIAHGHVAHFANAWGRAVGTPLACLLVVAVAVRASTAFSGERDHRTLDNLLATPLDNREILVGKWLGSLLSVRDSWWPLGAVWLLAMLAGGLHLLSVLMLATAWAVYAAFAAGLGLYCSLRSRTSLRATVGTLVVLLVVGTGQPLLWLVVYPLAAILQWACGIDPGWASDLAHGGLTPPVTLLHLAFPFGDWYTFDVRLRTESGEVGLAWAGVCLYAAAAAALWGWLRLRFGALTGRQRG